MNTNQINHVPAFKTFDAIEKHFPGLGNMLLSQIEEYNKAIDSMTYKRAKLWELLNGLAKASDMIEDAKRGINEEVEKWT